MLGGGRATAHDGAWRKNVCAQAADPLGRYVVLPGLTLMMIRRTLHPQSEKGLVRRSSDPQGAGTRSSHKV